MYNLNINVATGGSGNLLSVGDNCTTPKTPEILNSLIAMTNPFDGYGGPARMIPRLAACPPSSDTSSSSGSGAGSPLGSPVGSISTPSVQHTCSQLIKEGLKLTIQTKRRNTGRAVDADLEAGGAAKMTKKEELTAEDEERRRRRRERNKIAATKCRLKKRERTVNLVQESEILETQNHDLKSQIQELETQRRRLMDMLNMHSPTCMKNGGQGPPPTPYCADSPVQATYCEPQPSAVAYQHHYPPTTCGFNGGYSSSGVDGGCMA
ncbi:activating transcription factor 3 isoform X2 [Anabrus simplex]|uniref:activating transcription factor 3 isoform X2 n=1 Tax=Anabrus simplex TaxID=316456 RepID=UPI0034DCE3F9